MVSDKQLQANRNNGKLGGVKSDAGKSITKFNALDHGVLKKTLTEYEKDFYLQIYADLVLQYDPATIFEKILVERITVYYLKLHRVQKAEQEYMKATLNPHITRTAGMLTNEQLGLREETVQDGYIPQITDENIQKLADVYSRYEITIENRLYKAFHELEQAISTRKGAKIPSPTYNFFQMGSFGKNHTNS